MSFNQMVDDLNRLVDDLNRLVDDFNHLVDSRRLISIYYMVFLYILEVYLIIAERNNHAKQSKIE